MTISCNSDHADILQANWYRSFSAV